MSLFNLNMDANEVDMFVVSEWVTSVQICRMTNEISIEWSVPYTKIHKTWNIAHKSHRLLLWFFCPFGAWKVITNGHIMEKSFVKINKKFTFCIPLGKNSIYIWEQHEGK